MKTQIIKNFTVNHPIESVWKSLSDPTDIVTCVPGASIIEVIDEKNYKGKVVTKFGPVKVTYNGDIEIVELNEEEHIMKLKGKGLDSKGKGSADLDMLGKLTENNGSTDVSFTMDISIVGMLAQFGARLINDVSDQILNQFVKKFQSKLDAQTPTPVSVPSQNELKEPSSDQPNSVSNSEEIKTESIEKENPMPIQNSMAEEGSDNSINATSLIGTVLKSIFGGLIDFFKSLFGGKK